MRALIVDQHGNRAALCAARALKSDGWTVGVSSPGGRSLASVSAAVDAAHDMPGDGAHGAEVVAAVNDAIRQARYEVVFSLDDVGVITLSRHRGELDAIFPYGDDDAVAGANDKLELMRLAAQAGLAIPWTEEARADAIDARGAGRIVVKPRRPFVEGASAHVWARVAPGPGEARELASRMRDEGAEPLIQEHVEGHLMALTLLTDRAGAVVARVQQHADRRWPVDAGISARAHTVATEEELLEGASRLLGKLRWFGIAQLQFVRGGDGVPRLIDLNGRMYGSLALAVAAGLNLPALWGRIALELPIGHVRPARLGVRYQWLSGDIKAGLSEARGGPAKARALLGSLLLAPLCAHSVWDRRDPKPAIAHLRSRTSAWIRPR
ncbi:MAG: ATP-grasp domain-containing protein [Solirubrobacteraceae bacterium]